MTSSFRGASPSLRSSTSFQKPGSQREAAAVNNLFFRVLGLSIAESAGTHNKRYDNNQLEGSLKCYDCNSEYDPRCGDPFNPYSIGIINCTDRKAPEHLRLRDPPYDKPIVCRKIVQKVEDRVRIIRGCGYIPDEKDDKACVVRSGTININVQYCACTKSLCNTAINLQRPSLGIVLSTTIVGMIMKIKILASS